VYAFDFLGGGELGQTYDLINFGSTTFSSASQFTATDLTAGLIGTFTLTGSGLELLVVPEPSPWAALAGALACSSGSVDFGAACEGPLRRCAWKK